MITDAPFLPCRWCNQFAPDCSHQNMTETAWERLLDVSSARRRARRKEAAKVAAAAIWEAA